ncbi:MAG: hypothetical protein IKN38_00095 [Clostridia bacterium]|nr:hypothetical protein [Clostridia bacterium]
MASNERDNSIFREKSINKVSGPESLNDYIKVTTPSVWIVLAALLVLLVGILAWCIFGRVEEHVDDGSTKEVAPITYVTN